MGRRYTPVVVSNSRQFVMQALGSVPADVIETYIGYLATSLNDPKVKLLKKDREDLNTLGDMLEEAARFRRDQDQMQTFTLKTN